MGRVKIDNTGIVIAQPGYVHTSAERYLNFSKNSVMLGIYMSGSIAVPAGDAANGPPSPFQSVYHKVVINFGKTFPSPPIVLLCGLSDDGVAVLPVRGYALYNGTVSGLWTPIMFVIVTTTNAELWCAQSNVTTFKYIVLENTIG